MSESHEDESIAAYALGALDLESAERVHAHLGTCPRCRALTLRALHAACALPFSLPLYSAPADLKDRVLRAAQVGVGERVGSKEVPPGKATPSREPTAPKVSERQSARSHGRRIPVQIPWAAALTGWIVAVTAILYGHGLSDRVRVTRNNSAQVIAKLKGQLSNDATLRAYLTSPDLHILPLKNWVSATSNTRVELITRARSSQEIILADNLAPPLSGEIYVVWLKDENHRYQRVGTFTTNPRGEGLTIVNAALPLEGSSTLGISEEPTPAPNAPTSPLLFTVTLRGRVPAATPTAPPAIPTPSRTATARPTSTRRPTATLTVTAARVPVRGTPSATIAFPRIPGLPGM